MTRLMLASITGAIGYLLLYAGIAERGRFALRPWDALSASLNPSPAASSPSSSSGGGGVLGKLGGVGRKVLSILPIPGLP